MELRMEAVPLRGKEKQKVKAIYTSSFRKEERMPFCLMLIMSKLRSTELMAFYDGEILCGFVSMATIRKLTFVMFLAVDETMRSMGYGSGMLKEIQLRHPNNKIIITIERCDQEAEDIAERRRRKKFYIRNGYEDTGYLVELGNQKQEILIANGEFKKKEFLLFFVRYSNGTMWPKVWNK